MPNPIQILPNAGRAPDPNNRMPYATVSSQKPAPSDFTDPLFITFAYDPDTALRIDPKRWPACHGATLPAIGAGVILGRDSQKNWWVLGWEGEWSS